MFQLSQAITQGGPAVITILIAVGLAIWGLLATGTLRHGRECDYRDAIIDRQNKAIEDQRAANGALVEANRQQAASAQASLDLIKQELLPRLAGSRGA